MSEEIRNLQSASLEDAATKMYKVELYPHFLTAQQLTMLCGSEGERLLIVGLVGDLLRKSGVEHLPLLVEQESGAR